MTSLDEPDLLLVGPPRHGVVQYGADLATALRDVGFERPIAHAGNAQSAIQLAEGRERVHIHVTDRLFGGSPEEAADYVERLAAVTRLSITLHDLPQGSDGSPLARRVRCYGRIIHAADGVVVNSQHEARLVEEYLGIAGESVAAIPLGTSERSQPAGASTTAVIDSAPLRVLIAGYIYPGKGHLEAIRAVATVISKLRAAGDSPESGVVIALGAPSAGHEHDVEALRAEAQRCGVDFRVTGYLDGASYRQEAAGSGIPLAPHQHVSASRSMLDWVEAGRRPLVPESRYSTEMAALRPGTMTVYASGQLAVSLEHAWRHPETTRLAGGTNLSPTMTDAAQAYRAWWSELTPR